ncbi:triose-phosphate isomerase [Rhodohalobacter mucosus]|uniref:Triosephosphate isomerase n=1 Tax=Rhodohalobacter mucosus TaxID=2079485 RepID=A0A316TUQ2_9BACT|nr:triose-phosphate isomerase [Rhodohalobacter mucosus]PWN07588.1 triose-phosphate isomerase [Rhodohalobacter mucosus]
MRQFLIAGNWKMNAGPKEAKALADQIAESWEDKDTNSEILICPPFVSIPFVVKRFRDTGLKTGAQNVHTENNGAYTGEISTEMIHELSCEYVIAGHSERRAYFFETDELVAEKAKKISDSGLKPIVCVGEKLDERKNDIYRDVVKNQTEAVLELLDSSDASQLVIAYEPVWAIGTGETATPEQAQEMHAFIRNLIADEWGQEASESVRILYGGSMKPGNAEELLSQPDVDGGLIGGASLKEESFSEIISIAESIDK